MSYRASEKLADAAEVMAEHPAALQLRLLQTVLEVASEKNSTLVLPFPVELLRFLEMATPPEPTQTRASCAPEALADTVVAAEPGPGSLASPLPPRTRRRPRFPGRECRARDGSPWA